MPMFGGTEMDFSGLFPSSALPAYPLVMRVLEGTVCSLFSLAGFQAFLQYQYSETLNLTEELEVHQRIFFFVILSASE